MAEATVQEIRRALLDGEELALIDTREEGVFGADHILRAVNIPLSRFELDFRRLVPRPGVRLFLVDDDAGRVARAADLAKGYGYRDITTIADIAAQWRAAGYESFSGLNVPSKVFGEFIEHRYDTPRIEAEELQARLDRGEDLIVLDSRPMDEFQAMNIPTALDAPGGELVYRAKQAVPSDETLVVVNCAGRTRSIIGCQSLINAGLPNRVMALKNGTMGWKLAGLSLEHGATRAAPAPGPEAAAWARDAATRVSVRFGVQTADWAQVAAWIDEADRTTFLLDVRSAEEFEADRLAGAGHAPGGQLVQATDRYVGVQNARIVLADNDETRARMTASWLVQLGWPDVFVLKGGIGAAPASARTSGPPGEDAPETKAETISAAAVKSLADPLILDCSGSVRHRKGHIPGALWLLRSRVDWNALRKRAIGKTLVVTGDDAGLCALLAADIQTELGASVSVLEGGAETWVAAGGALETGLEPVLSPVEDAYYRPYDRDHGVEQAMQAYLDWEIALVDQLARDGTLRFPDFDQA